MLLEASARVEIVNVKGLHARAAASLRRVSCLFVSSITVSHEGRESQADSIMGLLMLAASKGSVIEVSARGEDAEEAVAAISALACDRFGEKV